MSTPGAFGRRFASWKVSLSSATAKSKEEAGLELSFPSKKNEESSEERDPNHTTNTLEVSLSAVGEETCLIYYLKPLSV